VVAVAHGPAVNVAEGRLGDPLTQQCGAEIHPRFDFDPLLGGSVARHGPSYHSQPPCGRFLSEVYPMKLELTGSVRASARGLVAYVKELPGAKIPKARRWRKLVRNSPRRSSLS